MPKRQLPSLRENIYDLIEESFREPFAFPEFPKVKVAAPKVNVSETAKEIKVTADIPGVKSEDLKVEIGEDSISISGKTQKEKEEKKKRFYRYERQYGAFRRVLPLPAIVDSGKAKAELKEGVLTVTIPKAKAAPSKKVSVKAAVSKTKKKVVRRPAKKKAKKKAAKKKAKKKAKKRTGKKK